MACTLERTTDKKQFYEGQIAVIYRQARLCDDAEVGEPGFTSNQRQT